MVLEKTLESPLDCKEIQPVHSEGDQPWVSLEGMMLKLKFQYIKDLQELKNKQIEMNNTLLLLLLLSRFSRVRLFVIP